MAVQSPRIGPRRPGGCVEGLRSRREPVLGSPALRHPWGKDRRQGVPLSQKNARRLQEPFRRPAGRTRGEALRDRLQDGRHSRGGSRGPGGLLHEQAGGIRAGSGGLAGKGGLRVAGLPLSSEMSSRGRLRTRVAPVLKPPEKRPSRGRPRDGPHPEGTAT